MCWFRSKLRQTELGTRSLRTANNFVGSVWESPISASLPSSQIQTGHRGKFLLLSLTTTTKIHKSSLLLFDPSVALAADRTESVGECSTRHEPDAFAHAVFRFSRLTALRCLTRRFSGLHFAADISPLPKCAQAFPVMTFASLMTLRQVFRHLPALWRWARAFHS